MLCNNYIHYVNDERNDYECFKTEKKCAFEGLYFDRVSKECYESKEICIGNNKKIFGKECIDNCPINSEEKDNSKICECLYYYFNNNVTLDCFDNGVTCEKKGYLIKSENTKECFISMEDCLSKNYSCCFNKICIDNNESDNILKGGYDKIVIDGNTILQITSTNNQRYKKYSNISTINLGKCE